MIAFNRMALNLGTLGGGHDAGHVIQKIKAAAKAGFRMIGLPVSDLHGWLHSDKRLRDLARAAANEGLQVVELSGATLYENGVLADRAREFAAAAALGAPFVSVIFNDATASQAKARSDWERFLELVSDVENVLAGFHFKGDSRNLCTLDAACEVVAGGPENGRVVLDVFDFWRGRSPASSLDTLPVELLGVVHLSDVRNVPRESARDENRVFPGEGVLPLTYIVSTLNRRNYTGVFDVEVMGECQRQNVMAVAQRAFLAARKLLGTSGPSHRKLHS